MAADSLDPQRAAELAQLSESRLRGELDTLVSHGAAAAPLLQALADTGDKGVRKLARLALHRLRSAGEKVDLPPAARTGSVVRAVAVPAEPAQISAPDPLGEQLAMVPLRTQGAADLYQVWLHDERGVVGLDVLRGRWRDVRNALRDLVRKAEPSTLFAVPVDEAAALVRRVSLANAQAPPAGVDTEALAELARHAGPRTPGERVRQTLADRLAGLSVVDAQATLDLRLDSGAAPLWVFGDQEFEAFARELQSIERSPLVLSASQTRDRQSERIEKFAESFFGERRRKCLSERLEELGAAWLAWADEDGACAALRMAAHLAEARRPIEIPVVRRSFDLSLEYLLHDVREQEADKRIVPP